MVRRFIRHFAPDEATLSMTGWRKQDTLPHGMRRWERAGAKEAAASCAASGRMPPPPTPPVLPLQLTPQGKMPRQQRPPSIDMKEQGGEGEVFNFSDRVITDLLLHLLSAFPPRVSSSVR